jgi:hypothetical protein
LALQDIQLQIGVDVIHQETHVLPQKHGLTEAGVRRVLLHASHFRGPNLLELKLDSFYWEQEPKKGVILL